MSKNKNGNLIAEGMADFLDRNQKLSLPKPKLEKKAASKLQVGDLVSLKEDPGSLLVVTKMPNNDFSKDSFRPDNSNKFTAVELKVKKVGKATDALVNVGSGFFPRYEVGASITLSLEVVEKLLLTGEMWLAKGSEKTASLSNVFNSLVSAAESLNTLGFAKSSVYAMQAIDSLLVQADRDSSFEDSEFDDEVPESLYEPSDDLELFDSEDEDNSLFDPFDSDHEDDDHEELDSETHHIMVDKNRKPTPIDDLDIDSLESITDRNERAEDFLDLEPEKDSYEGEDDSDDLTEEDEEMDDSYADDGGTSEKTKKTTPLLAHIRKEVSKIDQLLAKEPSKEEAKKLQKKIEMLLDWAKELREKRDGKFDPNSVDESKADDGDKPKRSLKSKHRHPTEKYNESLEKEEHEAGFTSRKREYDLDPEDENWFLE